MNTTDTPSPLRIPYGLADFWKLRKRGPYYYVDKTRFIPHLEQAGDFLFLIRPRRFGKSLLLSVLECYYDLRREHEFAELFRDTWIADHPTPEKNRYLILHFDFSLVNPDSRYLAKSFEDYCRIELEGFLKDYREYIPADIARAIIAEPDTTARLNRLFREVAGLGLSVYLFIDEYDNFANTLLVSEGRQKYHELTHGGGFFRYFFALFKGAAGHTEGGLSRLFITGVSPITMDDVTSGFNIGLNISLDAGFNALLGFTEAETERFFAAFNLDYAPYAALLREWYDQYRFTEDASESVMNSDMVLYFVQHLYRLKTPLRDLIDHNVRIDYGKLRHLVQIDRQLNGNFSRLREIIESGETGGDIQLSFPVEQLLQQENFISLLYYLGLLTFGGDRQGRPLLRIPNQTIRQLMYGYLRDAYRETELFNPGFWTLGERLNNMAYRGEWQAFFDFLADAVKEQASVRDYLQGEKMIQGFLLAYLNLSPYFVVYSEREWGDGFSDLFLAPFFTRYPDMGHAYLIELKYLARDKDSPAKRQAAIVQAEAQLGRYAADERIQRSLGGARLHALVLVYSGWELVYRAEV